MRRHVFVDTESDLGSPVRWTTDCFELASFGIEVSVEDEAQEQTVRAETSVYSAHRGVPDLHANWQSAPLDLGPLEFSGEEGRRQYARHPDGLVIRHGSVTGIVSRSTLHLGGTSTDPAALFDDYQTVFASALTHWLSFRGHFPIHAAAVGRDGAALLLLGRPGAGKSSAAWGAYQAGFDLLGDDTAFIRRKDGVLELCEMRKIVALASEILDEIPEGASQEPLRGGGSRDRWALRPDMLTPGWHRLIGLIIPAHGTDPDGALGPVDRSTLLPLAVGAYYASDDETQLRNWFPLAGAIARLPAWELLHSPEVSRRLEVSARLIAEAFDRATEESQEA